MKIPSIKMCFKSGLDNWEYGYFTMDIFFYLFILPLYTKESSKARDYFETYNLKELASQFKKGDVLFSFEQSLFYLECTNTLSKVMVNCSDEIADYIFERVKSQSERFLSYKEFEDYYLRYSEKTLTDIRKEYSFDPLALKLYNQILDRS